MRGLFSSWRGGTNLLCKSSPCLKSIVLKHVQSKCISLSPHAAHTCTCAHVRTLTRHIAFVPTRPERCHSRNHRERASPQQHQRALATHRWSKTAACSVEQSRRREQQARLDYKLKGKRTPPRIYYVDLHALRQPRSTRGYGPSSLAVENAKIFSPRKTPPLGGNTQDGSINFYLYHLGTF